MEKLKKRYTTLLQAYKTLEEILESFPPKDKISAPEKLIAIYRDAAIQRFEFCYDLTWKFLKLYLFEKEGIEAKSPKATFQACYKSGLTNEKETEQLLNMIEDRNLTTHIYDRATAIEISNRIEKHYQLMKALAARIKI